MNILVVGTLAYDDVQTPAGKRTHQLGGSAAYFSLAASYFADVGIVSIVGNDFRDEDWSMLEDHGIDMSGVELADGNTFHWSGSYMEDINSAETLNTELNVFDRFQPCISAEHSSHPYLFLANSDPELQRFVLESMADRPKLVAGDTMNHWIAEKRDAVSKIFSLLDLVIINEGEAQLYSGDKNLAVSADSLLQTGLRHAVIKRGEYGAALFGEQLLFATPALPIKHVVDPTGAGDSFAGGFIGYLASIGKLTTETMRQAVIVGSAIASITVEGFGTESLKSLTPQKIQQRYDDFVELTRFTSEDTPRTLPLRELK